MIKLIVKTSVKEGETKDYTYVFDQPVVALGRLKENDVQLPLSTVSGFHAQILKEEDNYYLTDRNSINGTFLNGERIGNEKKLLQENDVIRIQTFEIFFSSAATSLNIDQGATVQVARQMVMEVLGSWETHTQEKPSVIVMGGPFNGKQVELNEAKSIELGRSPEADVMIEHPSISRRHATISFTWSGSFLKDLNSSNGVFVNDQRINGSLKLHDRDEIRLGQQSSTSPIILIFSNPAEALLSKIEQQSTELASGDVAKDGVSEQRQQDAQVLASPSALPAVIPKESEKSVKDGEAPVAEPAPLKKRNVFIAVGVLLLFAVIGVGIALYSPKPPKAGPVERIDPDRGPGGQVVRLSGARLNPDEVEHVTVSGQPAVILSREEHQMEIRVPDFPEFAKLETKVDILVEGKEGSLGQFPFTVLLPLQVKSVLPPYGQPGIEVRVQINSAAPKAKVFFGGYEAKVHSENDTELVVSVPKPHETLSATGLKLPVTVKLGEIVSKNSVPFTVMPVESDFFQLAFYAKPYPNVLGFNEYAVESNIGPLLVLVARDQYGSSQERAERTAAALNDAVEFFHENPSADISLQKEEGDFGIYAKDSTQGTRLLLRAFPEDALVYSKLMKRPVELGDLANWWQMLLGAYFKTFVQIQSPADTGILSAGGGIFQQVFSFYPVSKNDGQKYYRKDFLSTMPAEQKAKLASMSLALPQKVSGVAGRWSGDMTNVLYPTISIKDLNLVIQLRQGDQGSLSGTAELSWRIVLGSSSEGSFQNVGYKKLGTFNLQGRFDRTRTYPVEFSFVEKDGRRLNFVGKVDNDILGGRFVVSSSGEEGSWSLKQK
jgi:pSer/pThr/pTyr-binding forkhead associated (FHA) protein